MRRQIGLALALLGAITSPGRAHFGMLLPETASGRKGEAIAFTYRWGHPFEHQLFDALPPRSLTVLAPDGKGTDLTATLEKVAVPAGAGKKVTAYRFGFTPQQRGDYVFVLQAAPVWMEEEGLFFEDTIKVVLHVQAQRGWDNASRREFEFVPLTRPYGLQPGMVFQARIDTLGLTTVGSPYLPRPGGLGPGPPRQVRTLVPLAGALVEVEHYNAAPPRELPPDEQVTRTVRTDPSGVATTTLTDPGWWCLTAGREEGKREREGKTYPVRQRCTLWVFVDEKDH